MPQSKLEKWFNKTLKGKTVVQSITEPHLLIHPTKKSKSSGTQVVNASRMPENGAGSVRYKAQPKISASQIKHHHQEQFLSQLKVQRIMQHLWLRLVTRLLLLKKPTTSKARSPKELSPEMLDSSRDLWEDE